METTTEFQFPHPKYDNFDSDFPTKASVEAPGHPGHTTEEQGKAVVALRQELENLKDQEHDITRKNSNGQDVITKEKLDYEDRLDTCTLLRFLRARKFNVEHAREMFINCEIWRAGFGTNDLAATFEYPEKEKVFQFYPQYYHKTDKDGRPVYIERLGKIDLAKLYNITTKDRMLQNLVTEYEKMADPRLPACSRKAGKLLETSCTIMDLTGVGVTSIWSVWDNVKAASGISQDYYPERLGRLYVINAPWGFSTVFKALKNFLDPVTAEKIHVLGSGYQKELTNQIPAENLPKAFGGTCECEGGCEFSDIGPWRDPEWAREPKWAKKDSKDESKDVSKQDDKPASDSAKGTEDQENVETSA